MSPSDSTDATVSTDATDAPDLAERIAFAADLARRAGDLALAYFRDLDALTVRSKGHQDVVSEADVNTEILIRSELAQRFPQDAFLGEETGATDVAPGQGIWVIDPIDGTQPFLSGLSSWCVSIGYVRDGRALLGAIRAPARDELFVGGVGFFTTLNGRPVRAHPGASIRDGLIHTGFAPRVPVDDFLGPFADLLRAGAVFVRDGSGALALCNLAAGRLVGYWEPHINSWDCVAGIALVEAAGLRCNDFLADDALLRGNVLIAGNDATFAELTDVINPHTEG